jgi:DNA-binding beta-propeller fold protein YncE
MSRAAPIHAIITALLLPLLTGCPAEPVAPALTPADHAEFQSHPGGLAVIGRRGVTRGAFTQPRCIAVAPDDTVWITDRTGRVQHLAPDGRWLGERRVPAIENGQPWGVLAGPARLFVADTHYHRVVCWEGEAAEPAAFGAYGEGRGRFIYPVGLAFGPGGALLVAEYGGADRIHVLDWDAGAERAAWGAEGEAPGEFRRPSGLAWSEALGRVYVADALNHRIQVFDEAGAFLAVWGRQGTAPGEFRYPYDLALAPDGTVWVVEYGNNRVQGFGPDGTPRTVWGGPGRKPGRLHGPRGIAVDSRGRVYVADTGNDRIQRFQPAPAGGAP